MTFAEDGLALRSAGEQAIIVYVEGTDRDAVADRVQALARVLRRALADVLIDLIPSYASVLVIYDPLRCDHLHAARAIRAAAQDAGGATARSGRIVEIPVYYAPESGADLEALAERAGLDVAGVIDLHTAVEYRVFAIGFAPGFAYLGDVDERIAAPRLSTPRQHVPRGAVAIADRQTAVYPAPSPGGWNLLGRSPLRMFDPDAEEPMPVAVGDRVRFVPIDRDAFLAAGGEL